MAIRLAHSIQPPCAAHPRISMTAVTPVTEVKKQPINPTQMMGYARFSEARIDVILVIKSFMA